MIPNIEELKLAINNIVWMYADKELTLEKAEDLSIQILNLIMAGRY